MLDDSTFSIPGEDGNYIHGLSVTAQNIQALDTATWTSTTGAAVDTGLTRALSYESQSTRTLASFSELDPYVLRPTMDLPLAPEESWHGPTVYPSPDVSLPNSPDLGFPYSFDQSGMSTVCQSFGPIELYPGSSPVFFPHGGQAAYSHGTTYPPLQPRRPFLPRTEPVAVSSQPAYGPQRILRPSVSRSHQLQPSARCVSSVSGMPAVTASRVAVHGSGTSSCMPPVMDPTADDFSAFISLDHEDCLSLDAVSNRYLKRTGPSSSRHVAGPKPYPAESSHPSVETRSTPSDQALDAKPLESDSEKAIVGSQANEIDEGRHRTHPDYSRPPHSDGLYRCPYKAAECCAHKPTKLKCNYEYDSFSLFPFS